MKIIFIASFLILLSTAFVSIHSSRIGTRIVGGQKARAAEFPWQAAVYVDTEGGKYFCGGSLISTQWVLSAAHCLYNARLYTVHLGSTTLQTPDSNKIIVATATSVYFPNFDPITLENDIGLIKFHMPITLTDYIQPIALAEIGDVVEGKVAVASGWGQISDSQSGIVNDLYYVNVVVISNAECSLTYGDQIKSTMMCSVGNYNEGICTGDTGGPLIMQNGSGNYVLIGVAGFFSQQGCETLHPSGYVRTDVYRDWIQNVTESV